MKLTSTRALALTIAGLAATHSGCQWASSLGLTSENWSLSKKATRRVTSDLEGLQPGAKLVLDVASGDIRVEAVTGETSFLEATFTAYGATDEEAARSLAKTGLDVKGWPDVVRISVRDDLVEHTEDDVTIRIRSRADFVLRVPHGIQLDLDTDSGNIDATGPFGSSLIVSRYGKIRVEDVRGDLEASSTSGDVAVADVRGDRLVVKSGYGRIEVARVEAREVEIATSSGDMELEHVTGSSIAVDTGYGDVELVDVAGGIDARSSSGSLRGKRVTGERVRMKSGYGNVRVEDGAGDFELVTSSGDIGVTRFRGELEARSGYGGVDVDGTFQALSASSSSGNLRACARPGSAVTSEWLVRSGYGSVDFSMPRELACRVAASTGHGALNVDLALESDTASADTERSVSGKVNGGGETIRVETDSGNVRVHALDR